MKRLLILGRNGFVGRNLYEYFCKTKEYEVLCPGKDELDATVEEQVERYLRSKKIDIVIHAAVYNPKEGQPRQMDRKLEYDLRMFYNFEKYSYLYDRMIYFGSGAEYDKTHDIINAEEGKFVNLIPQDDYGLAKYLINKSISKSSNIYNFRLFGLFGKYENWKKTFISGACCKAIKGVPITIRQNVFFDYLYVEDFCRMVGILLKKELQFHEYNLVSGRKIDLLTIAEKIKKRSGNEIPIYVCKDGMANEYTASNVRVVEEIGGFEYTSMDKAVSELYDWYERREEMIDVLSLLYQ